MRKVAKSQSKRNEAKPAKRYPSRRMDPLADFERVQGALERWRSADGLSTLDAWGLERADDETRALLQEVPEHERRRAYREFLDDSEARIRANLNKLAVQQLELELDGAKLKRRAIEDFLYRFRKPDTLSPMDLRSALGGCQEMERLEAALAGLASALQPLREYAERWNRGLRCVAHELVDDWFRACREHRPAGEAWWPWVIVAGDIGAILGVERKAVVDALVGHVGDLSADGPAKGAVRVVATLVGASPSTVDRDRRETGAALGIFRCYAEALVSDPTALALRTGSSAVAAHLVSRERKR